MTELTFTIPKQLWLTSNRHSINRGHRAAIVARIKAHAYVEAHRSGLEPFTGPVALTWTIRYPKGVRRDKGDASNAQPTTKACLDALVPRWLADDGPQHVVSETFRRGPNLDRAGDHEIRLLLVDQEVPF